MVLDKNERETEEHVNGLLGAINGTSLCNIGIDAIIPVSYGCKVLLSGDRCSKETYIAEKIYDCTGIKLTDVGSADNLNNVEAFDKIE